MFYASQTTKEGKPGSLTVRVRGPIRVRGFGASAAQAAAQGTQTAAAGIGKGVKQGVYVTRLWAAPRLESFADYTTTTVAPKVSSALRGTARQVRPEDATEKSRVVLTWTLLAAAMTATAGAVAALVRYKYRATMETDEAEDFDTAGATAGQTAAAGAESTTPAGATPAGATSTNADTGVSGRVPTSEW